MADNKQRRPPSLYEMAQPYRSARSGTPYRPGELESYYVDAINGPGGLPDFRARVNPAGMDAFLAGAPESTNVEDWRGYLDAFPNAAERMRRGVVGRGGR